MFKIVILLARIILKHLFISSKATPIESLGEDFNLLKPLTTPVYRNKASATVWWKNTLDRLGRVFEDRYQAKLGYWRSFVNEVIYKYLECGDPHFGFARVKCEDCNHEYLPAWPG